MIFEITAKDAIAGSARIRGVPDAKAFKKRSTRIQVDSMWRLIRREARRSRQGCLRSQRKGFVV